MTRGAEHMMDVSERCWVHVEEDGGASEPCEMDEEGTGDCCCSRSGLALLGMLPPPVQAEAFASAGKIELHHVLNAFQHSTEYGVHVCETFKDPRRYVMDAYWDEVREEACSIDQLHNLVGGVSTPLSDTARARLHQFSRTLARLSRRIDRVVLTPP